MLHTLLYIEIYVESSLSHVLVILLNDSYFDLALFSQMLRHTHVHTLCTAKLLFYF